jgi:hypothetical protein
VGAAAGDPRSALVSCVAVAAPGIQETGSDPAGRWRCHGAATLPCMRRHLGIGLAVLTVSACSGETSPPPPPPPTTPSVIETVVAQPKHVDEKTRCAEFISPDEVGAATRSDAKVGRDEGGYGCGYTLTRSEGKPGGRVTIALGLRPEPTKGLPVVVTSMSGNTAVEQRGNPGQ